MADARIRLLLDILDQAHDQKAWHGTTLRGSLRGLSPREALWRPGPKRHCIWELALHTAYWKYAVRRQLLGADRAGFPRVRRLPPAKLAAKTPRGTWTNAEQIHGVAAHDLYHAGQIQLIKRLMR